MSTAIIEQQTALPAGTWAVDPTHSSVEFAVEYLGGVFRGTVSPFEGKLVVDGEGARLEGSAPVAGVKVQDESLAAHLQSPEFFDAERAPEIRFESGQIACTGDEVKASGTLTIKGISRPIELTGTIRDSITDYAGRERIGLTFTTKIDRTQFGIDWNMALPSGEQALANDVTLTAELYLVKE